MDNVKLIEEAGLTPGEAKAYLALLNLGSSTIGPIVENSKVANSIIYKILNSLIDKGLVSYIVKEKTKYFKAAPPNKILEYIEKREEELSESKKKIQNLLPKLLSTIDTNNTSVQIFEGFKGFLTAWELMYSKLKKGDEYHSYGVYPIQEEKYHMYWNRDHNKRKKVGFKSKILFNQGTDKEILKNRNSFWGCESRYMPTPIKTPAWFTVYKDVTNISLQPTNSKDDSSKIEKPISIVIINQEIADTFEAYFQELWEKSNAFEN